MSVKNITGFEYTCDGCGKVEFVPVGYGVSGIKMTAYEENEYGGWPAEAWACSRDCIGKAVVNALDNRDED